MKIRDFLIGVGAQVDRSSFNQAENATKNLKNGLYAIAGSVGMLAGVGYTIKSIVDQSAKAGDTTSKLARNLSISAETLQEWQHIAGLEDFDATTAFKFLAKNMAEAKDGVKTSLDAFDKLGVSVTDSEGKMRSYDEVLMDISRNFPKLSEAERVQTAMDIFGRSGLTMVGAMMKGEDALKSMKEEARDMGLVLSGETLEQMEEYNDMNFRLDQTIKGVKNQISRALIPSMIDLAKYVKDMVVPAIKWMRENQEQLKSTLIFVGKAFMWVAGAMALWGLGALTTGIIGLTAKLTLLGWAGIGAFAKMLVLPLLVGAGILVLTGLVVELWNALTTDKKTIFGYLLDDLKNINEYWKSEFDPMIDKLRDILGTRGFADYMEAMQKVPTVQELQNRAKSSMATIAEIPSVNYATVVGFDKFASPMPSNTKTISIGSITITDPVDVDKMKSFFVDDFRAFTNSMEGN